MLKNTEIDIGFILTEPVTVLTNVFISISCFYFCLRLVKEKNKTNWALYWFRFFLWIGISAILGGVFHGLQNYLNPLYFSAAKLLMNISSMPASLALLRLSTEITNVIEKRKKLIDKISIWLIVLMCILTLIINQFYLIKITAGVVILYAIVIHYISTKKGNSGSGLIASGFIFSLSSLIVHTTQFSISDWFNFKDISHVIMNISLIAIFFGVNRSVNFFQLIENQEKAN